MSLMGDYSDRVQRKVESGEIVPSNPPKSSVQRQEIHEAVLADEQEIVDGLRRNLGRAVVMEAQLLEQMADVRPSERAQALRAVTDVKAKSIDGLLKMTGRQHGEGEGTDIAQLLMSMERRGLAKVNVSLEVQRQDG